MIKVAASARRSFVFPATCALAYAYYSDAGRLLDCLPHICLVRAYGPDRFRLLYDATELGVYQVHILADVQTILEEGRVLRSEPWDGLPPGEARISSKAVIAQGFYASRSTFCEAGGKTRIEYSVQIWAQLPTPHGLRLLPRRVVDHIARSITNMRMRETANCFVERSIAAYPQWLAEMEGSSLSLEGAGSRTVPEPDPRCLEKLDQQL